MPADPAKGATMTRCLPLLWSFTALLLFASRIAAAPVQDHPVDRSATPRFSRHVAAVFSRLGCNAGTCHGAVKGQNGFRLTLFAADPALDHDRLLREFGGRRLNRADPDASLLLLKATARVPHQGGKRMEVGGPDYAILRRWIAGGAALDPPEQSRIATLTALPAEKTLKPGESYRLQVKAKFTDGTVEDITHLCAFASLDKQVATVQSNGQVRAEAAGDTALLIRYRAEPVIARVVVPRPSADPFPEMAADNFIDAAILAKLRRLNIPPSPLADDATFLRRASLDVAGELPTPREIRAFLADKDPAKRAKKIDELLGRPGYAAVWTLKFCDLLKGNEFGVYADGLTLEADAPRFYQWIRARIEENTPYDQFVERILTATGREGRSLDEWAKETVALSEGYTTPRTDLAVYSKRKTLDLYWQRGAASGVPGALQVAHAFLGLRLECAQCHRHPHDVWQQDDLLSFANFFMRVRSPGFQGDNEKKFSEVAAYTKKFSEEAKQLTEQVKKLRETTGKKLDADAKKAKADADKLAREIAQMEREADQLAAQAKTKRAEAAKLAPAKQADADRLTTAAAELEQKAGQLRAAVEPKRKLREPLLAVQAQYEKFQREVAEMDRRSKFLPEVEKRLLHGEVCHLADSTAFASVTSPLGTQSSKRYRLLGQADAVTLPKEQDPRVLVAAWMRRPDNPFFARAIVNRVWAHYFGRGIIDPPDNLSPFNPASHPELLDELARQFVQHSYDLKWLHRTILCSRTYQQSSTASPANAADRTNYAYFYYRRLGGEVLVDALNQATGTSENMDMRYYHWPERIKVIEIPYMPRNAFVTFMLEHFGRPPRNSAVQCDCERDANASILQVLSFANHPRVWQKLADDNGQVGRISKEIADDNGRIEEVFLCTLSRPPTEAEREACLKYLKESPSPTKGLQGIMWSLLNTREFLLQH
jgi:hypothetical protein